ncbi:unnamed protein product, partial [Rotaria sp. Silwood1]
MDQCVKNNNVEQRWIPLTDWIQLNLNSNLSIINAIEIKVMLLLNIYYDYYCNDQLKSLDYLLTIIENTLQPSNEERQVFRILLQPEQNMIGYTRENNHRDKNYLNDLFKVDCQDDDELPIRHILVNLLAMILLGGKENILWTFVFEPLRLLETFENLYNPILAKHAIDSTAVTEHMAGNSVRAKVCHFVRARLLSTYHFLSIQFNQDDACLLFNRCFQLFAQFSCHLDENSWIKPIYKTIDEKIEAEKEFQNKIFYSTHKKLADYKQIINIIQSQSPLQTKLQEYTIQMSIQIEFIHFKTELCNPEWSQLSLTILRRLLDSFDFLKITRYIYALSQFHILLNRTFTQLIEQE